jgi:F-type H+-transporting ATPase subunit b
MKIDWWTLGFQAVNVVILVWLLQRFFWRPVSAIIAQRRDATQKSLADAKAVADKAAAALADIAATRAGFAKEHADILAAAHAEAELASKATVDAASKEAAALTAASQAAMQTEKAAAEAAWSDRASKLALRIAERLAARLQGTAVDAAFLDWLLSSIRALPAQARRTASAEAGGIEAVSAGQLEPPEQDRYRALITEAFGNQLQLTFRADPALIAGIELHGPHFALKNSWRADLHKILGDIERAAGQ